MVSIMRDLKKLCEEQQAQLENQSKVCQRELRMRTQAQDHTDQLIIGIDQLKSRVVELLAKRQPVTPQTFHDLDRAVNRINEERAKLNRQIQESL